MGRKKNVKLWNHLLNNLKDFRIEAGWFENTRYDDSTSVGFVAKIQNYGAVINVTEKQRNYLHYIGLHLKDSTGQIIIPPRPFMDNAAARVNGVEGHKVLLQEMLRVFEGRQTIEQATNRLGSWLQGIIQEEIKKINIPALSGATIEIRNNQYDSKSSNKSTKPLNATGVMFNTVQHKVLIKT